MVRGKRGKGGGGDGGRTSVVSAPTKRYTH